MLVLHIALVLQHLESGSQNEGWGVHNAGNQIKVAAYKRQVEVMSLVNPSISLAAPTPTAYRHHEGKRQSNRQLKKGQDTSTTLPSDFLRFRMDVNVKLKHFNDWTVPMTGTNVAALGDAMAHNNLSILYRKGDGAEKDEKKIEESIPALEEAAFAIAIASHREIWI